MRQSRRSSNAMFAIGHGYEMSTFHILGTRGFTLLEASISLALMAFIFMVIFEVLAVMTGSTKSGIAHSDLNTNTRGVVYDIVSELRQATAYSPNFYIEQDAAEPPSITFDLVAGVDGKGNIVWGNKVTYCLRLMPDPQSRAWDYLNIDAAQLLRIETDNLGATTTTLVEDNLPYRFTEDGVTNWGFTVSRDGNALSLSICRFADSGKKSGRQIRNASDGTLAAENLIIVKASGTYFLRNPQSVISLN